MSLVPTILQCPSCLAAIHFSHNETNVLQCRCGGAVVQRTENGSIVSKPFYIVQQPFEIIAPGTTGTWEGNQFRVLGRFRAWIEEFVFNYWTIVFDKGDLAYLGEGYGLYSIYKKIEMNTSSLKSDLDKLKVGSKRSLLKDKVFLLERKYSCSKWELEAEVLFPGYDNSFKTFEFASEDGQHIELIESSNKIHSYDVRYSSFADLHLKNTRAAGNPGKSITCVNCSRSTTILTYPYTQSFVCSHCGSRHALKDGTIFKKENNTNKVDAGTGITLGAVGQIKNIQYRVIGFALKEENKVGRSQWKEYTLYNEYEGYAFLSEYNGHWIYVSEKGNAPVLLSQSSDHFVYDKEDFRLFNSYSYDVINAAGEFPYNIFNDGNKEVKEFISPPEVWIQEKDNKEGIIWFLGQHINHKEVQSAFRDDVILPYKIGVGAIEPKGFIATSKIIFVAFIATLILLFVHLLTAMTSREEVLMNREFVFSDSASTLSFVTKKFHLEKRRSNLEFSIYAPADNSWFELEAILVNDKTGTEYSLNKGVEFYHGYSEGEYWTEGSTSEKAYLNSIPAGDYILQLQGARENYSFITNKVVSFQVRLTYDVPNHRNFLICFGFLLLWPFLKYNLIRFNEKNRWYNSPFSPYESE